MIYDNVLPTLLIIIEIDQWFNLTSCYLISWDVNRVYKIEYNPQHLITENPARWGQMQIIKASRRIGTAQDVNWINTSLQSKTWINCVVSFYWINSTHSTSISCGFKIFYLHLLIRASEKHPRPSVCGTRIERPDRCATAIHRDRERDFATP